MHAFGQSSLSLYLSSESIDYILYIILVLVESGTVNRLIHNKQRIWYRCGPAKM